MWNLIFVVENKKKSIKATKHNKSYIGETTAYFLKEFQDT